MALAKEKETSAGPQFWPPKQTHPQQRLSCTKPESGLSEPCAPTPGYALGPLGPVVAGILLGQFRENPWPLKPKQIPHLPLAVSDPPGLLSARVLLGQDSQTPPDP